MKLLARENWGPSVEDLASVALAYCIWVGTGGIYEE